jgi:formate--tetrahydrofolate ligase
MPSDLDIAREATPAPIEEIAWKLGIGVEEILPYGRHMAKASWPAITSRIKSARGALILVTSIHPTPFGEGKTVTTIGLNQGLNRLGKKAVCVIREPSMGPVFGIKGGAAGGGYSQVLPMEDINLMFTGDIPSVSAAHNLCSAILDNHMQHGNELRIDANRLFWPRVIDMNDRSLRSIAIGLGGVMNGVTREERFDITAASEVMAILALASDYSDLRQRLGDIVVAQNEDGGPVKAEDIGAAGGMALLLRHAFLPNLVQTLEGDPVFIHAGPFANIAHGNSSIIADKLALSVADYVVTEAGFGADMGAEKALHIKTATSGIAPDCIVLNVTIRAMKLHGGSYSSGGGRRPEAAEIAAEDAEGARKGASTNLARHIHNLSRFGPPVVVSINRFDTDHESEIEAVVQEARAAGAREIVLFDGHRHGGAGAGSLADAVIRSVQDHMAAGRPFEPLVNESHTVLEKTLRIATQMYGAASIDLTKRAERDLERLNRWGYGNLPICMAKSQYSFSHDAAQLGAPSGFNLPISEFRLNSGAGFVVAVCGSMMTMPGLPKRPAALDMDMDEEGELTGVFG